MARRLWPYHFCVCLLKVELEVICAAWFKVMLNVPRNTFISMKVFRIISMGNQPWKWSLLSLHNKKTECRISASVWLCMQVSIKQLRVWALSMINLQPLWQSYPLKATFFHANSLPQSSNNLLIRNSPWWWLTYETLQKKLNNHLVVVQ